MSYKYILGTKDKVWFIVYHTSDNLTFVTKDLAKAIGVNDPADIPPNWAKNTINCTGKFIEYYGSEMDVSYDEIVGIKIEESDLRVFELETRVEYILWNY